jgi:hypothetical protein
MGMLSDEKSIYTFEELSKNSSFFKYFVKYLQPIVLLFFMFGVIYSISSDNSMYNQSYTYSFFILLIVFTILYVLQLFNSNNYQDKPIKLAIMFFVGLLVIIFTIYGMVSLKSSEVIYVNYTLLLICIFIIITSLALFYNIFIEYLKKQSGALGLLINFLFFIPCLFSDLIEYLTEQYNITPNIVFVLFILEIVFVLLYFYIPIIQKKIADIKLSNVLLKKPVFLNKKIDITDHTLLQKQIIDSDTGLPIVPLKNQINSFNRYVTQYRDNNYGVSMWIFINPTNTSIGEEVEIFNYANGKPRITYSNNVSSHNIIKIYLTNSIDQDNTNNPDNQIETDNNNPTVSYEISLPIQKWNYFAFSYYANNVDLFINGILERTFTFNNNKPIPGSITDKITIGQDKNGLNGAICNIQYFQNPLLLSQVANTYNLLYYKNPPILI